MSIQKIISSDPLPIIPSGLSPEIERYLRNLHDYLTRLKGHLNPTVLGEMVQEDATETIVVPVGLRLNGNRLEGDLVELKVIQKTELGWNTLQEDFISTSTINVITEVRIQDNVLEGLVTEVTVLDKGTATWTAMEQWGDLPWVQE